MPVVERVLQQARVGKRFGRGRIDRLLVGLEHVDAHRLRVHAGERTLAKMDQPGIRRLASLLPPLVDFEGLLDGDRARDQVDHRRAVSQRLVLIIEGCGDGHAVDEGQAVRVDQRGDPARELSAESGTAHRRPAAVLGRDAAAASDGENSHAWVECRENGPETAAGGLSVVRDLRSVEIRIAVSVYIDADLDYAYELQKVDCRLLLCIAFTDGPEPARGCSGALVPADLVVAVLVVAATSIGDGERCAVSEVGAQ